MDVLLPFGSMTWTILVLGFYLLALPIALFARREFFSRRTGFIILNGIIVNVSFWTLYEFFAIKLGCWYWNEQAIWGWSFLGTVPLEELLLLYWPVIPFTAAYFIIIQHHFLHVPSPIRIILTALLGVMLALPIEIFALLKWQIWFIPDNATIGLYFKGVPVEEIIWYGCFSIFGQAIVAVYGKIYDKWSDIKSATAESFGLFSPLYITIITLVSTLLIVFSILLIKEPIIQMLRPFIHWYFFSIITIAFLAFISAVTFSKKPFNRVKMMLRPR